MEPQAPETKATDLKPPPGLMLFVFCSILIVVSLLISIIGKNAGARWLSYAGAAATVPSALLAAFGLARWQLGILRFLQSRQERTIYVCIVACGVAIGVVVNFLI